MERSVVLAMTGCKARLIGKEVPRAFTLVKQAQRIRTGRPALGGEGLVQTTPGEGVSIVQIMPDLNPRHRHQKSLYQRLWSLIEAIIRLFRPFSHICEPASLIAICNWEIA